MKFFVYILQSIKDEKFYIGCTSDVARRLHEHNSGKNKSTKYRVPFQIVYTEVYENKHDAYKREFHLKSPKGFLEKKKIIENLIIPR